MYARVISPTVHVEISAPLQPGKFRDNDPKPFVYVLQSDVLHRTSIAKGKLPGSYLLPGLLWNLICISGKLSPFMGLSPPLPFPLVTLLTTYDYPQHFQGPLSVLDLSSGGLDSI